MYETEQSGVEEGYKKDDTGVRAVYGKRDMKKLRGAKEELLGRG